MVESRGLAECPEGLASVYLALYAGDSTRRKHVLGALVGEVLPYVRAPTLLRRLHLGGWPDFGVGQRVLREEAVRLMLGEAAAPLLLNATPRYELGTASAPELVHAGWWWAQKVWSTFRDPPSQGSASGDASLDLGMRALLLESPLLQQDSGLVFIDVGAFDGSSLFSFAADARRNHFVLAFEPLPENRALILDGFASRGGLPAEELRVWDVDSGFCRGFPTASENASSSASSPSQDLAPRRCACDPARGCATLAMAGLSAVDQEAHMSRQGAMSAVTSHLAPVPSADVRPPPIALRVAAPVVRRWFEDFLQRPCVDIHLLKIDAEGGEFAALRGFEPFFAEHRVHFLFLEFWPLMLMTWGVDPKGLLQFLAHYGFHCRSLGIAELAKRKDFVAPRAPETFDEFVAKHTSDRTMTDVTGVMEASMEDLFCEDLYWRDPCRTASVG
eukprot:TRINITY_DN21750_c0_g1_i1.p1 TRINITY_DN21750_c0_g1~~TRINITY_DN21750_c0_g1_i1.p1  ORF type:complete len:445 (-),score=81.67 TRINITY_DN21750_c0_g1_i1:210-1544(-)